VPVTLVLYPPGDASMALYSWTVTLDQHGQWSGAYPVAAGTYDVRVRNLHTLRNVRRSVVITGTTTLALGTLHEGDANGDNTVNILDFARLRGSYFLSRGAPGFDPATDFDENGTVNILDFALLRGSYFLQGDIEVTVRAATANVTAATADVIAAAPVTLTLSPPSSVLGVGAVTPFIIEVDAGSRPLAGLDIEMTYRPGIVAITDAAGQAASAIVPGPHFAVVLQNTVDPSGGKLTFSAANFDRTVSGLIQVASFHLRGVNEGAAEASFGPRSQGADDGGRQVPFALSQPSIQVTGYHRYLPIIFRQ
jgi:hypothetical protein